ncbi:hypothetical protein OJF2_35570 [Aquisphaera giovannonii]|uniref:PEP-CTERM protein-sorting domain-containing protein n=1 Tax=Aquisphaera giovannonii TaxID=406548 RepID=A0A5B9W348_9BACT|nr:PEP-CTERM sorting domain-containing protein [Aquisphaera giovannonii]QEH35012.1 hypothetical protein OJF2_35570 [Aquisphaera giovannonii]
MNRTFGVVVALLVGCSAPVARGDLIYQVVAEQADYTAEVGATVDVRIFLRETATGGESSQIAGAGNGLLTAGVRLDFGGSAAAKVLSAADVFENAGFTSAATLVKDVTAGSAGLAEDVDFLDPAVQGIEVSPGVAMLELGVFRFTALAAGLTVVTVEDFDLGQVNFVTAGFVSLDDPPSAVGPSTFSINVSRSGAVPEPASVVLAASGLLGLGLWARLRRHRIV